MKRAALIALGVFITAAVALVLFVIALGHMGWPC